MKETGEPIVMVTAYDYPSAQVVEEAGVDIVLVGDTAAMVVLGHDATTPVGMDEMMMLTAAVRRGLKTPMLIGDMPFGSYEALERARDRERAALRQGGRRRRGQARARRPLRRPRTGDHPLRHPGHGPRRPDPADRDRARRLQGPGQTAETAAKLAEDALALQSVGCFAIVFEAIPAAVTEALMQKIEVPVIGIGAGPATDGQVLVFHDLLGIYERPPAAVRQALRRGPRGDGRRASAPTPRTSAPAASRRRSTSYSIEPDGARRVRGATSTEESLAGEHALGLVTATRVRTAYPGYVAIVTIRDYRYDIGGEAMEMLKTTGARGSGVMVIVGALNWGILGLTGGETNVVAEIFGTGTFDRRPLRDRRAVAALVFVPRLMDTFHIGHGPHPRERRAQPTTAIPARRPGESPSRALRARPRSSMTE